MVTRRFVWAAVALAVACDRRITGPQPRIDSVSPPAVCSEQLTTRVSIAGDGFSPVVSEGLIDTQKLNLPKISLVPGQSIDGAAVTGEPVVVADPADFGNTRVRWSSATAMELDLTPNLVQPGLFAVRVENQNQQPAAEKQGALLAVPPPTLTSSFPDLLCSDKANEVTLSGDFFIRSGSELPKVAVGPRTFSPKEMKECRKLPGDSGLEACKAIVLSLSAQALPVGTHRIVVTNPGTVACQSTATNVTLTLIPQPTVAKIEPDLACTAQGATNVVVTGTGFASVTSGATTATPTLFIGTESFATTLENCAPVTGPKATVQVCTTLKATIAQGKLLPTGSSSTFDVKVVNPPPVDCESKDAVKFTTVPPPKLTSVVPDLVCTQGVGVTVTLNGSGFLTVDSATPTVKLAGLTFSATPEAASCSPVQGPTETVRTCTAMKVTIPQGAPVGSHPVTVTNPAPAGCSSTETVTLVVAPPPEITTLSPDIACAAEAAVPMNVQGTGFIKVGTTLPTVNLAGQSLTPTSATGCTPVLGTTTGAETCTGLLVSIPQGTTPGQLAVTVTNPPPAGCTSAAKPFYLAPPPALTSLTPPGMCLPGVAPVTVTVKGQDFLKIGATGTPSVQIGTRTYVPTVTQASCTAITGFSQALEKCTEMPITIAQTDFVGGNYPAVVRNPAPAACSSTQAVSFSVQPPPTLAGVTPAKICRQGGTVTLTGTNFTPNMSVRLLTTPPTTASSVTVNGTGTSANATFTGPVLVGGPFDLEVVTGSGACKATLTGQLTVTEGPVVFFVDPPVIYNGIKTQATVYASGFAATGLTVRIRPTGTTTAAPVTSSYNPAKANRIVITIDPGTAAGDYDVLVSDANTTTCPGELIRGFKVVSQTTLSITGIDPPFGHTGSDTGVTITADAAVGGGMKPLPRIYLNPATAGAIAIPLESVALISASRATAVVPAGQTAGTYGLIVVNPDGGVGVLANAFKVVPDPIPVIDSVSPASLITQQASQSFTVSGANFRGPSVSFRCQDAITGTITTLNATVSGSTATSISATVSTTGIANGQACVLRVTNSDGTYADFSSVVFTNPAEKLTVFRAGPTMTTARRAPVAQAGFATRAAQFLFAIGGDGGTAANALDSVEAVPLDIFGNPGAYFAQRYKLTVPRTHATGQRVGRFLYVAGGRSAATTVRATVERSYLLDPRDRVDITDLDLFVTDIGGLGPGVYYYRVAAAMGASDPFNPSGENLPSDPFPISVPSFPPQSGQAVELTLRWATVPGATSYRVYRTVNATDAAGTERLLATVTAPATSYLDKGSTTPAGTSPLPIGSTGTWTVVGIMPIAREGAASTVARDAADSSKWHLYVVGGKDGTGTMLRTYSVVPITIAADQSQAVGTVANGTNQMGTGRWLLGAMNASSVSAPRVGTNQYIYACGGDTGTGPGITGVVEVATVGANGVLSTWTNLGPTDAMNPARAGFGHAVANNFLFAFGGGTGPSNGTAAAEISTTPPDLVNWQSTSATMIQARYLMGSTLHGAFVYIAGGQTPTGATDTTEQIIW